MVRSGSISFTQARELLKVSDKSERKRLISYCQNNGATVQVLQGWVQDYLRSISVSPPPESAADSEVQPLQSPDISRKCQACDKSVEISQIRQVFFCPPCRQAILSAIEEEKARNIQNSDSKAP